MLFNRKTSSTIFPNPGMTLDVANPLAQGLLFYPQLNQPKLTDLISGGNASLVSASPVSQVKMTQRGLAINSGVTNGGIYWTLPAGFTTLGTSYSFVGWFNIVTAPNGDFLFTLPNSASWTSPFYIYGIAIDGSGHLATVYTTAGNANVAVSASASGYANVDSKWHFIAVTRNGATNTFYCDHLAPNVVSDGTNATPKWSSATQPLILAGVSTTATAGGFAGYTHSLGFWNRTLSVPEVMSLYNTPNLLYWTPQKRYFNFPGSGGAFAQSIGHPTLSTSGTLVNPAIVNKTFAFPSDVQSFSSHSLWALTWNNSDGHNANGCLSIASGGHDGTDYIEWTGPWTDLGVSSVGNITAITLTGLANKFTSIHSGNGINAKVGSLELRDNSGTLIGTLWTGRTNSGVDGSWNVVGTQSAVTVPSGIQSPSTTIKLRLNVTLDFDILDGDSQVLVDDIALAIAQGSSGSALTAYAF